MRVGYLILLHDNVSEVGVTMETRQTMNMVTGDVKDLSVGWEDNNYSMTHICTLVIFIIIIMYNTNNK